MTEAPEDVHRVVYRDGHSRLAARAGHVCNRVQVTGILTNIEGKCVAGASRLAPPKMLG